MQGRNPLTLFKICLFEMELDHIASVSFHKTEGVSFVNDSFSGQTLHTYELRRWHTLPSFKTSCLNTNS